MDNGQWRCSTRGSFFGVDSDLLHVLKSCSVGTHPTALCIETLPYTRSSLFFAHLQRRVRPDRAL